MKIGTSKNLGREPVEHNTIFEFNWNDDDISVKPERSDMYVISRQSKEPV